MGFTSLASSADSPGFNSVISTSLLFLKMKSLSGGSEVKDPPTMQETHVLSLGQEDPSQKEILIYFSILAWEIPWTEEPDGLSPRGCKESDVT